MHPPKCLPILDGDVICIAWTLAYCHELPYQMASPTSVKGVHDNHALMLVPIVLDVKYILPINDIFEQYILQNLERYNS